MAEKYVCDRCGREVTDRYDIEQMFEGMEAWQNSVRSRGEEPRGIFPCENFRDCHGEMVLLKKKGMFGLGGKK